MTHLLKTLLLCALLILPAAAAQAAEIGRLAPAFTLSDTNGSPRSLKDFAGKIVVLEWTNHQCPYVKKHYDGGAMQALQKEATAQGVIWLSIASSAPGEQGFLTPDEANALITAQGSAATARLLDMAGTVGRLYGASTTPHMFVIDQHGVLVYEGAIDDAPSSQAESLANAKNHVRAALSDLLAGRPVATPQTRPYGCAVKYGKKK